MPVITIGSSSHIYQPDGDDITMGPDGSGQATLVFEMTAPFSLSHMPQPLSSHPAYPNLMLYEASKQSKEGGISRITCTYKGVLITNPYVFMQQSFDGSVTSEPIETHPKFSMPEDDPPVTAAELDAITVALENNVPYTIDSPDATDEGVLLYNKKRRGVTSWLRFGAVYSQSYVIPAPPSDYGSLGKVVNPPGAPGLPDSQNYLWSGYSWTKAGGVVTVRKDYMASGRKGWDSDLY